MRAPQLVYAPRLRNRLRKLGGKWNTAFATFGIGQPTKSFHYLRTVYKTQQLQAILQTGLVGVGLDADKQVWMLSTPPRQTLGPKVVTYTRFDSVEEAASAACLIYATRLE